MVLSLDSPRCLEESTAVMKSDFANLKPLTVLISVFGHLSAYIPIEVAVVDGRLILMVISPPCCNQSNHRYMGLALDITGLRIWCADRHCHPVLMHGISGMETV